MNDSSKILVVDDDDSHRTMLRTLIGGWGYTVSEADDGSSAIQMVQDQSYDLVLMDVRMVRVSGLEALDEIKAYNPAIPVIIMTAYSSVETAVEALKQGAHDYLTKPLDFDKLELGMCHFSSLFWKQMVFALNKTRLCNKNAGDRFSVLNYAAMDHTYHIIQRERVDFQ